MVDRTIWYGFIVSFYPKFYRKIVFQPFGRSLEYLTLFVILFSLVLSLKYVFNTREWIQEAGRWIKTDFARELANNMPEINIINGEVSSPVEQPYIYELDESAFILDTTGSMDSLDQYTNCILITKHKFIIKKTERGNVEIEEYDVPMIRSLNLAARSKGAIIRLSIGGRSIISLTDKFVDKCANISRHNIKYIIPIIPISLFLYYITAKLIHLMLFSLISLIICKITDARLKYRHLLNIGAYVIIPSAILAELIKLCGINPPLLWIPYLGFYVVFLTMAILQSGTRGTG